MKKIAFEGAQGFGAGATGGRGGDIVKVTNLKDSGEGSLRWALEDLDDPRIVVFAVGGQIDLKEEIRINGDVTLAGQTAPGGITVSGARLRVIESNVIIRGMNLRPGDSNDGQKAENRDGISVGKNGRTVEDVIIDSNSISWAIDENTSTWGSPNNVTWSNNLIAEALQDSRHPKGDHSMGMLIGDGSENISIIGNLFASNDQRNAVVKDGSEHIEYINNVVYNYGRQALEVAGGSLHAIGNVMIAGDDSNGRAAIRLNTGDGRQAFYVSDNLSAVSGDATNKIKSSYVFDPSTKEIIPSEDVLDWVVSHAGVIIDGKRSKIDQRIIDTVVDDDGRIIDSQKEVGGYLDQVAMKTIKDSDDDGIPDAYEKLIGSDANRADSDKDADGNGLANIEDYINALLDGSAKAPSSYAISSDFVEEIISASGGSGTNGSSSRGDADSFVIEAEDFKIEKGFATAKLSAASEGKVLRAHHDAEASTTFDGKSGTYDIGVQYFDETDGVSYLEVHLNGKMLDAWHWNANLGSALANMKTRTTHVIDDIEIEAGDEIVLIGTGARSTEPLRIDALHFTPSDTLLN
ncbi:hypothetical protein IQ782_22710 [Salipiger pacificus]|uniref:Right handed beta helix region n=1 Tax=Salipiger mangrovisoli TaxID=2865933 RepID=A0ABR9X802_9RHOB|nr:hypothetical protein [Salipiger mangrovisoli]